MFPKCTQLATRATATNSPYQEQLFLKHVRVYTQEKDL